MGFKFTFFCNTDKHKVECLTKRRKGQMFNLVSEFAEP